MASNADLEQHVTSLLRKRRLAALDVALSHGLADADAGRVKDATAVEKRLAAKYQGMAKAQEK